MYNIQERGGGRIRLGCGLGRCSGSGSCTSQTGSGAVDRPYIDWWVWSVCTMYIPLRISELFHGNWLEPNELMASFDCNIIASQNFLSTQTFLLSLALSYNEPI